MVRRSSQYSLKRLMMCGSRDSSAFVNAVWMTPCHAVGATYVTPEGSEASNARY